MHGARTTGTWNATPSVTSLADEIWNPHLSFACASVFSVHAVLCLRVSANHVTYTKSHQKLKTPHCYRFSRQTSSLIMSICSVGGACNGLSRHQKHHKRKCSRLVVLFLNFDRRFVTHVKKTQPKCEITPGPALQSGATDSDSYPNLGSSPETQLGENLWR